jgi:c(7)-type cytochrome triheme protein
MYNDYKRGAMKYFIFLVVSVFILPAQVLCAQQNKSFGESMFGLPPMESPETYGEIFMGGASADKRLGPVRFAHWTHRVKFTCRVCHYELEFAMKAKETPIVCDNGRMGGKYCVTCHNGKISFAPKDATGENCTGCHGANASSRWTKFRALQKTLPAARFGNEINWSKALEDGLIKPADSLSDNKRKLVNIKTLTLQAEWSGISSAIFPHKTHELWLDCSSCHPDMFNIKKKSTESLRKSNMIKGESCGLCHLRVAFPLNDCVRCHPTMRRR